VVAERQAGTMPRPAYVSLVKRVKGQERLSAADKLLSTAVSRVRQPIWR
jgi:putative exporter of polyketide antibiotics